MKWFSALGCFALAVAVPALASAQPTTVYEITTTQGVVEEIYSPAKFPDDGSIAGVRELWSDITLITPTQYMGGISQLLYDHEAKTGRRSQSVWRGQEGAVVICPLSLVGCP